MLLVVAIAFSGTGCGLFSSQPDQLTVMLDQNGKTIYLHQGDRFLLKLGEGFEWEIYIADPAIVSRVPNIAVVRGAQGVYKADQKGRTTLEAVGEPLCRKEPTPCAIHSILFKAGIEVR